jgi:hypothetical protein
MSWGVKLRLDTPKIAANPGKQMRKGNAGNNNDEETVPKGGHGIH